MYSIYLRFLIRQTEFTKTWDFWFDLTWFDFHFYHISNRAFEGSIADCIAHWRHILCLGFQSFSLEEQFSPNPLFYDSVQWIFLDLSMISSLNLTNFSSNLCVVIKGSTNFVK